MKIDYSVTGAKRKELAGAIAQELNMTAKYLGAPTFGYEAGDYLIDKNGTVTGPDNRGLIADLQGLHSFTPSAEEYSEPGEAPECTNPDDHLPRYTEEEFGLGVHRTDPIGEDGMQASDVPEPYELVIEMPLTGFTPEKLDNLFKMVNAKAPLLKAVLKTDVLPIHMVDDSLKFPWFQNVTDYGMIEAAMKLLQKLCEAAKTKKRVNAKEKVTDNPKYAMRCWLLSLGFIGDDYKSARKTLLRNLDGNSAFRSGAPVKAEEVTADE